MSIEYANKRIKEALNNAKGNHILARQQIINWAFEDAKLLQALTKPHLTGIVAYNIERVASGRADAAAAAPKPKAQKSAVNGHAKQVKDEQFGLEILKAITGSPQIFGLEDPGAPRKRSPVSKSHLDAIAKMAKKNKAE